MEHFAPQGQELNRILERKLELKMKELDHAKEANKKLEAICTNKNLKERGQLDLELQEVKGHLLSRDEEVKVSCSNPGCGRKFPFPDHVMCRYC